MIIDVLKDAILQNIGPLKQAPKGWHKRNCMLCHTQGHGHDTRSRFGIQFNPQSIAMNCFNCGFSAGYTEGKDLSKAFKFFLNQIHLDQKFVEYIEFEIFKNRNKIKVVREGEEKHSDNDLKSLSQKWRITELPPDSLKITEWLKFGLTDENFMSVVNYALNRKIFELDQFYWTPLSTNQLNQRLIIPYYYNDNIVGFTSRLCYETKDKKIPKYYQQCPHDFVYNLDRQQDWSRKYVIVTEGVLDAWIVDGVGILGEVNQEKIDIINRLQKHVIVCPDRDKKGQDLVDVAIDNGWDVAFPKWESGIKDAAAASEKYGKLLTTYSIIKSAVSNKEKIQLLWKIEENERTHKHNR